ncbi:MAG: hypothetical protein JHC63_08475 [Acidimicrobiia bacterium]|jgi:hypothetical protein|nr:hypothetical protein [Acidimicrobiia bacterium]
MIPFFESSMVPHAGSWGPASRDGPGFVSELVVVASVAVESVEFVEFVVRPQLANVTTEIAATTKQANLIDM